MRVGQNIKTIAEAKRISIKELSRMVGIPYTTLYNMVNRNTDRFDLGLLEDIAHSLDVPIGALLESGELSLTEILGSRYSPSSNGALSKHRPPEHESEDSQDTGNHLPNNTETDNSIPFDIGDKRYDTLCNFDRLNALGKEVTIKLLLTIRAHQFDGDLRRQFIFLLKHSNNKAVYQLNQALANLVFIDSFNDQYATPQFHRTPQTFRPRNRLILHLRYSLRRAMGVFLCPSIKKAAPPPGGTAPYAHDLLFFYRFIKGLVWVPRSTMSLSLMPNRYR